MMRCTRTSAKDMLPASPHRNWRPHASIYFGLPNCSAGRPRPRGASPADTLPSTAGPPVPFLTAPAIRVRPWQAGDAASKGAQAENDRSWTGKRTSAVTRFECRRSADCVEKVGQYFSV